jgi:hypothetical protein
MTRHLPLAILLLLLAACSDKSAPATTAPAAGAPAAATPAPSAPDVPDALAVLAAKGKADGDAVAVVGRVRFLAKGVFTLVDDTIDYCGHGADTMKECPTPWDYCCKDPDVIAAATIVVKAQTKDGAPIAKQDLGLRQLDLVAVKGVLRKQEDGSLALVATDGWFRRERPTLPSHVKFD